MGIRLCVLVQMIVLCAYTNITVSDNNYTASPWEMSLNSLELSPLYKLYNKCVGKDASKSIEECLSTQLVILLDQMLHQQRIPLTEGVQLVGEQKTSGRSFSEEQMFTEETLESLLPRSVDTRQGILDSLMLHKLLNFFKTHRLQIDLPDGRAARGLKMKKLLLPFLMGVVLKATSIIPVILSIMSIMALQALLAGKAALVLTGLIGLRNYLLHGSHNGQHKGAHIIQHDLGTSSGHGVANLLHNLGVDHQYDGHGYRDSQEADSSHRDVLYGRSFTDVHNGSVNTEKQISAKMDEHRFTTTGDPQHTQNFHYPGLTKTLAVSA